MSIVYDSLKKIHDQRETGKVPPVKKSVGSSLGMKIMAGILGCLVLGAGLYFFLHKS